MPDDGLVSVRSVVSVRETTDRLLAALAARQLTVFARIDHAAGAASVGLVLRPTELVIFGNPKGGTPLMLASPSAAIDLPLKILVAEDSQARTWVSYNSPEYLKERHGLPQDLVQNIAIVATLADKAAE